MMTRTREARMVAGLIARPWTVRKAMPWIASTHRKLKRVQGGLWAIRAERDGQIVGCALVGHAARLLAERDILCVLRVAVLERQPNACSLLYGACSRTARGQGATGLVTYTHAGEPGTSLRAAGWIFGGMTDGGEHDRDGRPRQAALFPEPKQRWWAPWSAAVRR